MTYIAFMKYMQVFLISVCGVLIPSFATACIKAIPWPNTLKVKILGQTKEDTVL